MASPNLNTFSPEQFTFPGEVSVKLDKNQSIIVIGAGAFGGWTALYLQRRGLKVTLVDAWGPGNSRSSSGDETRVIRSTYGDNRFYFDLNVRALTLWKENEKRFGQKLFYNTGVLWLCYEEHTPLVDASIPFADAHRMSYRYLSKKGTCCTLSHSLHRRSAPRLPRSFWWISESTGILSGRRESICERRRNVSSGAGFPGQILSGKMEGSPSRMEKRYPPTLIFLRADRGWEKYFRRY